MSSTIKYKNKYKLNFQGKLIPESHFYIGLSSGKDSLALAHYCYKNNYNFSVIHINNKFTELDDSMELNVIKFCTKFNIKYKIIVSEPKNINLTGKEMACRNTRLDAFRELDSVVCLAHTLSDCVEQHYMNFFRGCEHFYPIPIKTQLEGSNSTIVRPFMLNSREEINNYILENNLMEFVVEDPLNSDLACRRAWIRHNLIPMVDSLVNPGNGGKQINMLKIVKKKVLEQYKLLVDKK